MSQQTSEMVLTRTVTVALPLEEAFRLYTEGIATWWPYSTHSVEEEQVETVVFEAKDGGRIYERTTSGEEHVWGSVLAWDPPTRVVHTWHPGRGEESAQEVQITFEPVGPGTRVELVHTGWERIGDRAAEVLSNYGSASGWDLVLGKYVEQADA
jgi:uncharacterized protein YndB with AHSA1/START domain